MNALAAAALAAGELICEFSDGYRKSLLAHIAGDAPRTELVLVFEGVRGQGAEVLSSAQPGRRAVKVVPAGENLHFIQSQGPSVRVTTLTGCLRTRVRGESEVCTRFSAQHAWHFDATAHVDPEAALRRLPSGAASGVCEPWRID